MIAKVLRDLALTLYDHPTEFLCLSAARLWMAVFGLLHVITWAVEITGGPKFSAWGNLNAAFATAAGAYGLKKWREGGENIGTSDPARTPRDRRCGEE